MQVMSNHPTFDMLSQPIKSKAKRERASWQQRIVLEKVFQTNQYPDLSLRTQLSLQLGMSPRKIQIWFQNRRTKHKNKNSKSPDDESPASSPPPSSQDATMNDVNLQNSNGNTLLIIASSLGQPSVEMLLAKGAKPNIANHKGQTPLLMAVQNGHEQTVETLLKKEHGCNVNIREFDHGESPLHIAALKGNNRIAAMLLHDSEDINVNIRDHDNRTPLHHACVYGHVGIVVLLLQNHADVNASSNEGITPLHAAALNGNSQIVEYLLDCGANINYEDNFGYTALDFAVREGKEIGRAHV